MLNYRRLGDPTAPPVVLLHGGSSSSATWHRLAAALAAAGTLAVAPDLRGHGASPRTPSYPLTGYRDDVLALIDRLGLDRFALVGHSLGAYTAALIAQEVPERVTRLVMEEPPPPGGLSSSRFLLPGLTLLMARRGCDPRAVLSAVRQLRVPDPAWWQRLTLITAPTLVISGGPRSHIPPSRLAQMTELIPDARLHTIPVGHRVHSRRVQQFIAAVLPFLSTGRPPY
jgi:pimeloyl-ACP methyl ester carboxylesterase